MNHKDTLEYVMEATKASPPVAVTGLTIAGASLQDWVLILTAIYTVIQIALLIRKFFKERRDGSGRE